MLTFRRAMIFLIFGLAAFIVAWHYIAPQYNYKPPVTLVATAFKPTSPLTSFNLIDTNGKQFTEKSLRGHWTLLFFGYTGCPDICPATLAIMRETWDLQKPAPARFVFASIDPIQVNAKDLKTFLQNYNQDFIGISGTKEDMDQLRNQLGIFYELLPDRIDHTSALMLIDPQARLSAVFTPPFTAQEISKDLKMLTKS